MIVYFLRHASAGKKLPHPKKDERRPLDDEGILQTRYLGRMLAALDLQIDHIISSPLKRATQTASLVANELAFEKPVKTHDALRPEARHEDFLELLAHFKKSESIIVVGHNPTMAEFLSKTISRKTGTAQIDFKKGTVARVDLAGRSGTLEWMVTPRIARALQTSLKSSSRPKTARK
jgi:phosphohistidine phosphatase